MTYFGFPRRLLLRCRDAALTRIHIADFLVFTRPSKIQIRPTESAPKEGA